MAAKRGRGMSDLIDRKRLLNSRVYSIRSNKKTNYEKLYKNLINDIINAPTVDTEKKLYK